MIRIRRSGERGRTQLEWLDSRHTFSFGNYRDPAFMHYRALQAINDDRVTPGGGFANHPHRDVEILTWVLDGELEHRDSLGNTSVVGPGEVQRMTAGTGIMHSEINPSATEPVHFLQIWIEPEREDLEPSYEQRPAGALGLVASRDARDGALTVHQDVDVYAGALAPGDFVHDLRPGRHAWIQVATGALVVNGQALEEGDGAAIAEESRLLLRTEGDARVVLFDLA